MNELKFNSQICTTEIQSQRLLDLGLKPETADMCYIYKPKHLADTTPEEDWVLEVTTPVGTDIPAWSLHRLLCLLYPREDVYPIMPSMAYKDIIDDIENEIKCGGFNKEYLKQ